MGRATQTQGNASATLPRGRHSSTKDRRVPFEAALSIAQMGRASMAHASAILGSRACLAKTTPVSMVVTSRWAVECAGKYGVYVQTSVGSCMCGDVRLVFRADVARELMAALACLPALARPDLKRCVCSPWFTGEDCSTALCPRGCTGHGTCMNGNCVCDSGWNGYDCSLEDCPRGCSGHGVCQVVCHAVAPSRIVPLWNSSGISDLSSKTGRWSVLLSNRIYWGCM